MPRITIVRPSAAAALAVALSTGAHASLPPCPWELHVAPHNTTELILYGIHGSETTWTCGRAWVFEFPFTSDAFNYMARWNGSAWIQTPVPQPSTLRFEQTLHDVITLSDDDAIAVGDYNPDSGPTQAQATRWNGSSWEPMNAPFFAEGGGAFYCLGKAGDSVWAGGVKHSETDPPAAAAYPMAARLAGNVWQNTFVPPLATLGGRSYNYLRAIEGSSDSDVWAGGIAQQMAIPEFGPVAMMVHYDGNAWTQYDLFDVVASTNFSSIEGIAVLESNNAWAAGFDFDDSRQVTIPLILHWDGSTWSNTPLPTFPLSAELRAIDARSPTDIYAAGTQTSAGGLPHALMLRYDGTTWSEVSQTELVDYGTWFRTLYVAEESVWVAGQSNGLQSGITQRLVACQTECPADMVPDGELNFFDVQAFLAAFAAKAPKADFNNDGQLNFFDVQAFLAAFAAGCP